MNIENYIETQYSELQSYGLLYAFVKNQKLCEVLMTLHYHLILLFRTMNERLLSGENGAHFWADPSRSLKEIVLGTYNAMKGSAYVFEIDSYYNELMLKCRDFLSSSGGSVIHENMQKSNLLCSAHLFANIIYYSI